jgi:hypothetical protein
MVFYREKDDLVLLEYPKTGFLFMRCIDLPISAEKRQQKHMAGFHDKI